ncbi:glycoside hydrolase [Lophiotrema nucula]|uniref:lytic cellulose monooxygenase (C4-dehydrogenating) n=1 Tax=Lophiotrema nucula TaxID=690887 RepID=A0A6A5ZK42_9PLEO|nr:glycoside hydrolase [Lophiotrema nucula]
MKASNVACLALLSPITLAHYTFGHLVVNKTITERWRYVRDVATQPGWETTPEGIGKFYPQYNLTSTNMTCGRAAINAAPTTQTATVIAGEEVGFYLLDWNLKETMYTSKSHTMGHYGPAQAYLAKAPNDDLTTFSGIDADWLKIGYFGPKNDSDWSTYMQNGVNFTLPAKTPPGKYLLRFEHFTLNYWYQFDDGTWDNSPSEFFVNCAQINVVSPGGGIIESKDMIKIPGPAYGPNATGILVPEEMAGRLPFKGLLNYKPPGPVVWTG